MATWKEFNEPYIKVIDRVHRNALNPSSGEGLIVGIVLATDAGPSTPTLVSGGQREFAKTYASGPITEEYIKSLDKLYEGDIKTTASTMFANAYRLAGSNTLLVCRATKAANSFFAKPLTPGNLDTYILKDGELLKKVPDFKIVVDQEGDSADHDFDGWSINISGVGIVGNRTSDQGPKYDYFVRNLPELVNQLNETNKFFSPYYKFYSDEKGEQEVTANSEDIKAVIFKEVYIGTNILNVSSDDCPTGKQFLITCEPDWDKTNPNQKLIDLNSPSYSGFTPTSVYATNVYNSASNLKIRIRRFNHDAVVPKEIQDQADVTENGPSPWSVLKGVLKTFTKNGTTKPSDAVLARDFYEVCVFDPSLSDKALFFNLGNITGRGDITLNELNDSLNMIGVSLPDDLLEIGLNYYGYEADNSSWVKIDESEGTGNESHTFNTIQEMNECTTMTIGQIAKVGTATPYEYYKYVASGTSEQVFANLTIDPTKYKILSVSTDDFNKALDTIARDEVYITEGLCDLGNTDLMFQNYMANMAITQNYFYPISTGISTNYISIANQASKISKESPKLYLSAPWDVDSGTLGFKFYASPSVLYWEAVARNQRDTAEFAGVFGQSYGVVQYQKPLCEFNKKTRQLLLSRKINTVLWNNQTNAWNMNDNFTKQSVNDVLSDDGNSRLAIRISKVMPVLLRQFIGWKINNFLWQTATSVIDYWFKSTVVPMRFGVDDYVIQINEENNPKEIQAQNKMVVSVRVRYSRSLKYIEVYHDIFDVGMDISEDQL